MKKRTLKLVVLTIVILVVAGGVYYFWHRHNTQKDMAKTTSHSKTAQNDYTGDKTHKDNQTSDTGQGGAVDNHGDISSAPITPGITSASGAVTVLSPASNDTLASGSTIRGTATGVTKVQYRVIDNEVGVLAQGSLEVVNGTYSGTLQFKPQSSSGRVDVYSYNDQGQEINSVQIPVTLKG